MPWQMDFLLGRQEPLRGESGNLVNYLEHEGGKSILMCATKAKLLELVTLLVDRGAKVD